MAARNLSRNSRRIKLCSRSVYSLFCVVIVISLVFLTILFLVSCIHCAPQEFAKLDEDEDIYKLVGPVLLKQEKSEAVEAVERRLEFIEKEM